MTIPTYSINGGAALYGVTAAWENEPLRQNDDGTLVWSDWKRHVWTVPVMPVATYLILAAAQGGALTNIQTNDYADPNEAATYTSAVMGVVNGQHRGINVRDVTIEFRVKLS